MKDLEIHISDEFNLMQNLHLYTQKSVSATCIRPFGEVDGQSPLQLSSRSHFAKLKIKKLHVFRKISLKTKQLELKPLGGGGGGLKCILPIFELG